jgi:hypothetical protein
MFETNESKRPTHETTEYCVKVDKVIKTKNDSMLMLNLDINGVLVNSCILKEVTVKKDGQKYKAGDKCYVLDFPSQKVGDKYYRTVWFPVSNENMQSIIEQVKELM